MRKVLSFVLVLTLVLGSFGFAFADDATTDSAVQAPETETKAPASTEKLGDVKGLACEDAVRVLTSLDVVSGYEDGSYKPEQTVTRAEMASLLIKALGLKETNAIPKFPDSQNHWAKGYIAYANTLGIISGRSTTVFDPDATVTYDEATTMIIKALGYTDDSLVGTYPASYVSRAKVLGILDGVSTGSGGANRGDVATMIYQALDEAIGKVDKDGNFQETAIEWNKNGIAKKYDTMLERLGAKIYDVAGFYDDSKDNENFIVTGDEDAIININPYKGALVSAYMNKDKDIIAIKEVYSTFVTGSIDDDSIGDYTLKADALSDIGANGSTTSTALRFENGYEGATFALDREDGASYVLAADVSGKKINEVYSVAFWTVTDHAVVEADDIKDIDNDHKFLGVDFKEDNNDDIDMDAFELVGIDSLDDLKADMVAYVYKNDDDEIARIAVSDKTVSGEVTKVTDNQKKITLDGKTYKYATNALADNGAPGEASTGDIKAGDDVTLTLDAYGYIYDFELNGGKADKYAIVLKTEPKDSGKIESDYRIKLFLADGTSKIFEADEDDIDNTAVIAGGEWKVTAGAIVKYGVDKNGVITSMYVQTDDDKDLRFESEIESGITAKGYMSGKEISKNAVIFNFTGDSADWRTSNDADDYSILTYEKILDIDTTKIIYVYDTNKKQVVAMLLNDAAASDDVFGVVVSKGTNNSDAGAYYDLLIDGKEVTYDGTDSKNNTGSTPHKYDVPTTAAGVLYMVKFDADGAVKEFKDYDEGSDKKALAEVSVVSGDAVKYSNRVLSFDSDKITITAGKNATSLDAGFVSEITVDKDVIVYVNDGGDWELGSTSDLRNLEAGQSVKAYDVVDEDGIFDVVLIYK